MKKYTPWIFGGMVLALVLIGWGVTRVGNITVRRVQSTDTVVQMQVSNPLAQGVGSVVHWVVVPSLADRSVFFFLHTLKGDLNIGQGVVSAGQAVIHVPCTVAAGDDSLLMRDVSSGEVLGTAPVTLLAPGPDCVQ
jgi:hypothetical protein